METYTIIYIAAGFAAGFIATMAGSGSVITLPLLVPNPELILLGRPTERTITPYDDMILKMYRSSQKGHTKIHCSKHACSMVIALPHPPQRRRMRMPLAVCFGFTNPPLSLFAPFPEKPNSSGVERRHPPAHALPLQNLRCLK